MNEPNQQRDFYSMPQVYDVLHARGTRGDVEALERISRVWCMTDRGPRGRRAETWLEPGCGTGRLLVRAAKRGKRAAGFDREAGMVAYARERARAAGVGGRVRVFVAEMEGFDEAAAGPGAGLRVDLAFNLINTIRHLESDRAMLSHFAAVSRVLRPGGVYAVGISLSAYGLEQESEDVWSGRRGGLAVDQVVQYIPPSGRAGRDRAERVVSHLTVRRGEREEHVDSAYTLRGYNLRQWTGLIGRSALRVLGVVDQDGRDAEPAEPGYAVWVLGAAG